MSKLKLTSIRSVYAFATCCLILVLSVIGFYTQNTKAQLNEQTLLSQDTILWGKGEGPINVRMILREQDNNQFTLEGQVKSTLNEFEIEWKLPDGVSLVDGELNELVQKTTEQIASGAIISRTIAVQVNKPLERPHLVFAAYSNENYVRDGERFGSSTVFNLAVTSEASDKLEKIKTQMKSRKIQKMVK